MRGPYFVDETEKGRMPGQKGRGAGIALRSRCGGVGWRTGAWGTTQGFYWFWKGDYWLVQQVIWNVWYETFGKEGSYLVVHIMVKYGTGGCGQENQYTARLGGTEE